MLEITEVKTIFVWTTSFLLMRTLLFRATNIFSELLIIFSDLRTISKTMSDQLYNIDVFVFLSCLSSFVLWKNDSHFFKSHRLSSVFYNSIGPLRWCTRRRIQGDLGGGGSAPPHPSRGYSPACRCLCKLEISNHHYVF